MNRTKYAICDIKIEPRATKPLAESPQKLQSNFEDQVSEIFQISRCRFSETRDERRFHGSAIILAIVLTSLLAIIGVLFLISSRVDSIATSSIADNMDLTLAVDTVIAKISQDLAEDITKGAIDANCYADYPDASNFWLACLEPYQFGTDYFWRQVSNIYGPGAVQDVQAEILPDYNNTSLFGPGTPADADGDGVSDSNWIQVPAKYSSKGKLIYAAVRIVDNGGMLNVNTGFKFDPSSSVGVSHLDINLMALAALDNTHDTYIGETQDRLLSYRCGTANASFYEPNVIWQYGLPVGAYTPFDISDELKLRNRYIVNYNLMTSRIETLWTNGFDGPPYVPRDPQNYSITNPADWFWIISNNYPAPCLDPCTYDVRHIATTYNYDRIITPAGDKMVNINTAEPNAIRDAIKAGFNDAGFSDVNAIATQITANLIDYRDIDNEVTVVYDDNYPVNSPHFGFERPCVYISEIAQNFYQDSGTPPTVTRSYAIELYKPYPDDVLPDSNWQLVIDGLKTIQVNWSGSNAFHVFLDNTGSSSISNPSFTDINGTPATGTSQLPTGSESFSFDSNSVIELQRHVYDPCTNSYANTITVDRVLVPPAGADWLQPKTTAATYSFQRDIHSHKPIRRLWDSGLTQINSPTLGTLNSYTDADSGIIQAHPANQRFTNIGEFGQLFYARTYGYGGVEPNFYATVTEPELRINLADPNYQQIFKYLTVMDPCDHGATVANESRIKGRININTAPWFVIAQLPWVSYQNYDIARAIVDKREIRGGYRSIGELMRVNNDANDLRNIGYYENKTGSVPSVLMTPADGIGDANEQRDVIFARISNLVTVRSDVFTAYILVRIGPNGPQKRVIAILDRSEVPQKPVKVIAIQQVPDPR